MGQTVMRNGDQNDIFNHIPLMRPWLDETEWQALKEVILSGWVSQGPKTAEFERALASFTGAGFGVATNSCTSAIHLAFLTQGIRPGDEIIVPVFTCMADANAVLMAGAVPVFADIDERTFNIDPECAESMITHRTRGLLIVDQIGLPADLDSLTAVARKHDLIVVDDAATSLGARYRGKPLGGHGLVTTFSFHPRKMITTGEGGMMLTDSEEIAEKARIYRSAGASVSDFERHRAKGMILQQYDVAGFNYRMTDIQAAIGLIQFGKLEEMVRIRNEQARYYTESLGSMDELECPHVPDYAESCFSSYLVKIRKGCPVTPSGVIRVMSEKGISCRFGIMPLHREPYFRGRNLPDTLYPVCCDVASRSFFIPIFPGLKSGEMKTVVSVLKSVFKRSF
ncbi:DegT/DnrJ/EryC1/StrS family aminotransferase [bacterium]|nr:DegT/DnrJ/EryC1/StrS family aminotransferase [bacterium]